MVRLIKLIVTVFTVAHLVRKRWRLLDRAWTGHMSPSLFQKMWKGLCWKGWLVLSVIEDVNVFHHLSRVLDVWNNFSLWSKHTKIGADLEAKWEADLAAYLKKYPEEGAEFKSLITGELPAGWEKALPVSPSKTSVIGLPSHIGIFSQE